LYSAFFYKTSLNNKKEIENKITKEEKLVNVNKAKEEELKKDDELKLEKEIQEKINKTEKTENKISEIKTTIKDGLFVVVGNRAITKLDIVDEIKKLLILNNMSYSDEKRDELQQVAIKSIVKRTVKEIEINKNNFLEYNQNDLNHELIVLANRLNMDLDTLKNVCISNGLDFSKIENQIKTELLWNSLIFYLYSNRITVNLDEINEQLKLNQNKKDVKEYLISEIIIKPVDKNELKLKIKELKNKIKIEGFEATAMNLSISQSAIKGGDLGWLSENEISKKFMPNIQNTPIGGLSEPILLKEGILFFKIRNKRTKDKNINLEQLKNQLVRSEKTKILNMYSMSHYDNVRRSTSIKFINE